MLLGSFLVSVCIIIISGLFAVFDVAGTGEVLVAGTGGVVVDGTSEVVTFAGANEVVAVVCAVDVVVIVVFVVFYEHDREK